MWFGGSLVYYHGVRRIPSADTVLNPDPEIRESSLVLVVVLVRFIGFCADERADLPGNYFVPFV